MKGLIIVSIFLMSFASFATTRFCGKIEYLSFQTADTPDIKMVIKADSGEPTHINVIDEENIEYVIGIVSKNRDYTHETDEDDYVWDSSQGTLIYKTCVFGSDLREFENELYMDDVIAINIRMQGR